jgi:hypothetical protein
VTFWADGDPTTRLERLIEVAVPPQAVDASGFYISLRTGFRF